MVHNKKDIILEMHTSKLVNMIMYLMLMMNQDSQKQSHTMTAEIRLNQQKNIVIEKVLLKDIFNKLESFLLQIQAESQDKL